MKSIKNLGAHPTSLPLVADDILEFHSARLLLLLKICGERGQLKGLTKMAKLDFFVRYPQFFEMAARFLGTEIAQDSQTIIVESKMVRYHYGPWDQRYYHVLAYLKAKNLIKVTKEGTAINLSLTDLGSESAIKLEKNTSFASIVSQMIQVNNILGNKKGTELKNLVYEIFDEEVAKLSMGEVITQ